MFLASQVRVLLPPLVIRLTYHFLQSPCIAGPTGLLCWFFVVVEESQFHLLELVAQSE